ncbi:MAG: LPS export ABC transporter periplasmic protein LptC [Desulfobacterales bacterium]|nr:LPS export ABC transporter periplasmic protein LptC [Desulfobacterales bacterium]
MKKFLKKQWPLLGLAAMLVLVSFYIIKSGEELVQDSLLKGIIPEEGVKLKNIHYTQEDPDEKVKWVLDAEDVSFSGDKKSIRFKDFALEVRPEGKPVFNLKGKKGTYSRDPGDIDLWGDLVGLSGNGYRIVTDHLLINEKTGHLRTESPVDISGPFFSIKGRGLFVDLEKESFKVLSDVTTVIEKDTLI